MQDQNNQRFCATNICKVLIATKLISTEQAKGLLLKEKKIKELLWHQGKDNSLTGVAKKRAILQISFIDVVLYLKIERLGQPGKIIDEDLIYKVMAAAFHLEYIKIDPLKLELNLVTGTISKSFALRHLLLPLKVEVGKLVVYPRPV